MNRTSLGLRISTIVLLTAGISCSNGIHQQARCWELTSLDRGSNWGILIDRTEILRMGHKVTEYCKKQGQKNLLQAIRGSKQLDIDSIQLPDYRLVCEFQGQFLFGVSSNDVVFMDGKAYLTSEEITDRVWHLVSSR